MALSDVYLRLKQPNEARSSFTRGLLLREQLVEQSPQSPEHQLDLALSLIQRSKLLREADPRAAGSDLERSRVILATLHSKHPAVPIYAEGLANARYQQSSVFQQLGDAGDAEAALWMLSAVSKDSLPRSQTRRATANN